MSLGLKLIDEPYFYYGVKLVQCTVGMPARPPPQLKYVEVLCFMCLNKIQIQSSEFLNLPHLRDLDVQKPSSRQMGNLKC